MPKKIILTGAPSTGKSTILQLLIEKEYTCMEEISREIIREGQKQGIKNIFETEPLAFSELILNKRIEQYKTANALQCEVCFFDRGLPDVTAYLKNTGTNYKSNFDIAVKEHPYDIVFIFPPWKDIYTTDHERLESFENANKIHKALVEEYSKNNSKIITVPKASPKERLNFILKNCNV